MEDIERIIKIAQQKRLANQRKLECLDTEPDENEKLLKELRNLRKEGEQFQEDIAKHLNMITAHKHTIHKILHSSKDISGLPVSHNYAQDMQTMFTDTIEFLNHIGDTYKMLNSVEESNVDPSKLIEAVATCTEALGSELYQVKSSIAQLDTLRENIAEFQHYILENNDDTDNNESIDNSTITDNEVTVDFT